MDRFEKSALCYANDRLIHADWNLMFGGYVPKVYYSIVYTLRTCRKTTQVEQNGLLTKAFWPTISSSYKRLTSSYFLFSSATGQYILSLVGDWVLNLMFKYQAMKLTVRFLLFLWFSGAWNVRNPTQIVLKPFLVGNSFSLFVPESLFFLQEVIKRQKKRE